MENNKNTNKTIFTDAEKQDILNTIDWYMTEYGDDGEMMPKDISEWVAMLCSNNVDVTTVYKIVKRTQATDDSVRVCVQEYLDDSVTQVYNTCEQNLRIKNSIR